MEFILKSRAIEPLQQNFALFLDDGSQRRRRWNMIRVPHIDARDAALQLPLIFVEKAIPLLQAVLARPANQSLHIEQAVACCIEEFEVRLEYGRIEFLQ